MIVRGMEERDLAPMARMVYDTWAMEMYDEAAWDSSLFYVWDAYDRSAFAFTSEEDGKALGCIMCRTMGVPATLTRSSETMNALERMRGERGSEEVLSDLRAQDEAYDEMLASSDLRFDGQILFLMVSESARGRGAGKALFLRACEEFRGRGCEDLVVFTDDYCGYGFYDAMGASKLGEVTFDMSNEKITVMMYSYRLRVSAAAETLHDFKEFFGCSRNNARF